VFAAVRETDFDLTERRGRVARVMPFRTLGAGMTAVAALAAPPALAMDRGAPPFQKIDADALQAATYGAYIIPSDTVGTGAAARARLEAALDRFLPDDRAFEARRGGLAASESALSEKLFGIDAQATLVKDAFGEVLEVRGATARLGASAFHDYESGRAADIGLTVGADGAVSASSALGRELLGARGGLVADVGRSAAGDLLGKVGAKLGGALPFAGGSGDYAMFAGVDANGAAHARLAATHAAALGEKWTLATTGLVETAPGAETFRADAFAGRALAAPFGATLETGFGARVTDDLAALRGGLRLQGADETLLEGVALAQTIEAATEAVRVVFGATRETPLPFGLVATNRVSAEFGDYDGLSGSAALNATFDEWTIGLAGEVVDGVPGALSVFAPEDLSSAFDAALAAPALQRSVRLQAAFTPTESGRVRFNLAGGLTETAEEDAFATRLDFIARF